MLEEVLQEAKPMYLIPRDNLALDVLAPAFGQAESVECLSGYFSSASLVTVAPGLAAFINQSSGSMRLLISPHLSPEDQAAILEGTDQANQVLDRALTQLFDAEGNLDGARLARHQYDCLAYLVAAGRLEIRVAIMRDGLFHPKCWIFRSGPAAVLVHGSANSTGPGLSRNMEYMSVERSWEDPRAVERISEVSSTFELLWEGEDRFAHVVDLPTGLRDRLFDHGEELAPPGESDFWDAWWEAQDAIGAGHRQEKDRSEELMERQDPHRLRIPADLRWGEGPFSHQRTAVEGWEDEGGRGIFAMATGSGKTITALVAATRLQERLQLVPDGQKAKTLLLVIAVPSIPLLNQWQDEVRAFGINPRASSEWDRAVRLMNYGNSICEVLVVTHAFVRSQAFRDKLQSLPKHVELLLVADEVHGLVSEGFVSHVHDYDSVAFRLGLSATPEKFNAFHTKVITSFFGKAVIEFSLGEAIDAGCLVPYEYRVHVVALSEAELEEYEKWTSKISLLVARAGGLGKLSKTDQNRLAVLSAQRHAILEMAEGKLVALQNLLDASRGNARISKALVYATSKGPQQLLAINELLASEGYRFHEITQAQSHDRALVAQLLADLAAGRLEVITCKKVLDEGISVPEVSAAFIVASSASEREWVQRRGRVLRKAQGKDRAVIHDFVVIPPGGSVNDDVVRAESSRITAFAQDASWGDAAALELVGLMIDGRFQDILADTRFV